MTLTRDGAAEPFGWRLDGNSLVISPTTPLAHGSTYSLTLGQATDLAGNVLATTPAMTFALPALASSRIRPPVVLSVYPGYPCATSSSGRNLAGGLSGRCAGGKSDDDVLPLPAVDPQRDLHVMLSQSLNPASVKLGTTCNAAASFRVERVDASGNCQGVVPGRLTVSPRELAFKPADPWVKGQLYRYVLGSNGNLGSSAADCTGTQAICGSNDLPLQTQLIAQTLADAQNAQRGGPDMEIYFKGGDPLGGTSIGLRVLPVLDVNANFRLDDSEKRALRIDEAGNYVSPAISCRTGQGLDVPATVGRCVAANGALLQPDRITNGKSYSGAATAFSLGCANGLGAEDEGASAGRDCQGNQFLLITASLGARLGKAVVDSGQDAIEVFVDPSIVVTSGAQIYADLGITPTATPVTAALCSLPLANLICDGAGLLT
ncbi:MAG: Ig-like domain-containing protein, partial [Perlucidibaca sp.]